MDVTEFCPNRKKQLLSIEERQRKGDLCKVTDRTTETVGRAALSYTPADVFNQKLQVSW